MTHTKRKNVDLRSVIIGNVERFIGSPGNFKNLQSLDPDFTLLLFIMLFKVQKKFYRLNIVEHYHEG